MSTTPMALSGIARCAARSAIRTSSQSLTSHIGGRRFLRASAEASTTFPRFTSTVTSRKPQYICRIQRSQQRNNSSQSDQLKQVGFEDINTKLPASPASTPANIILVDVREPAELTATGIIPGAVSVPLASQPDAYFLSPEEFETRFGYPKPGYETAELEAGGEGKEIVFYCRAGVRAKAAAQLAVQAGYDPARIRVYDGSWLDWTDKGGRVEEWEGRDD